MSDSKYCSYHAVDRKEAFHAASITGCPYCEIDRLKEENEKLSSRMVNWPNLFDENMRLATANDALREELARYAGAVEVEGVWKQDGILFYPLPTVQLEFNQKVRVLVIPDRFVDANKTMEVE